jgi:uncharacterized phage protein gp47/JayE
VLELQALFEVDQHAEISASLDLSADSVLGQVNGIFARHLGIAWEAIEAAYNAFDPDRAEGEQLTGLSKLTGTDREGASKSQVLAVCTLEAGTTLIAGTHFAHVTDKPDVRFTPVANFTAPGAGGFGVDFEAEVTGPVQALATTLRIIAAPVVGWTYINNPLDATLGRYIDDDGDLRVRREQGLAHAGSSGVDQIRADVLAVEDVTSCQVFENFSDATDANGLPPKSFEVVLWDDAGADDDAVAQAIWTSKPGGIEPIGAESGTALDRNGDPQVMRFSRATAVLVYVTVQVTPREGYVGDVAFKTTLATTLDAQMSTGQSLSVWDVSDAAHGLGAKVEGIKFGTAPSPTTSTDLVIGNREIARFDTSRIVITA